MILKDQGRVLCPECEKELRPLGGPRCMKCGKPVAPEAEFCKECSARPRHFTQGKSIFLYDEKMKVSLIKYKYFGCREYGDFYSRALAVFSRKELDRWAPDLIVPVPLHRRKQRMRGFNQSAYLAAHVSKLTGIPWDNTLVRKIHPTKSQKKLTAVQRRKNLQEAFRVERRVDGLKILVIDDVYTTGSTVDAMAACLKEMGAEKVYFLTVCSGQI